MTELRITRVPLITDKTIRKALHRGLPWENPTREIEEQRHDPSVFFLSSTEGFFLSELRV